MLLQNEIREWNLAMIWIRTQSTSSRGPIVQDNLIQIVSMKYNEEYLPKSVIRARCRIGVRHDTIGWGLKPLNMVYRNYKLRL